MLFSELYAELQCVEQFGRNFISVRRFGVFGLSRLFFLFILEDCVFDVVVEVCVVLILDEIDDFFDLFVGYKRALHTLKVT